MTFDQIEKVVSNIKCPIFPSWELGVHIPHNGIIYMQVRDPKGVCVINGDPMPWGGRKWNLSYCMTETELVLTAFKAFEAAIDHEFREHFRYRGVQVFDPRRSIAALITLDGQRDTRA